MESFWHHQSPGNFEVLRGPLIVDVLVIGAGYTGCWLAYWLRDSGLRVAVIDGQTPGYGASGRNGGLLLQGPAQLLSELSQVLGLDNARDIFRWTRRTFDWVQRLADQYDFDYRVTGSLYVGGDSTERDSVEKTVDLMKEVSIPARVVPRVEQPLSIQRLGYDLGAWFPDDGMMHPVKLMRALLAEAQAGGVRVYHKSRALSMEEEPHGARVVGSGFAINAERVVIATNAYTGEWLAPLKPFIQPVRGQVLATEPLPAIDHVYPVYADHGFNYWHQRPDGRLIVGGFRHLALDEEVGTDLVLHQPIQARLHQLAADLAGRPVTVTDRWAGTMAMTPDHRPLWGHWRGPIWIAVGYNGHGGTVAPVAARMVRDNLIDGTPVFAPYDVARIGKTGE